MMRTSLRTSLLAAAMALPLTALAQQKQYVSDVITLSIREQPSNDAGTIATVRSGAAVTVLESLGEQSFARIRTEDGVTGWVTARYLTSSPAARDQLEQVQAERDAAQAQIVALEQALSEVKQQLEAAKPALELASENERLRSEMKTAESATLATQHQYNVERARRRTLIVGGGLVCIGAILGLLLPWLGRGRRRRYGDF